MFHVRFSYVGGGIEAPFNSLAAAFEAGKRKGFAFTVSDQFGIVSAWCPIGGRYDYRTIGRAGELRQDSPRVTYSVD
jgi:hypothetical protein